MTNPSSDTYPGPGGPRRYPADKVRQGDIVLRRPWQRWVFGAGLVGLALFGIAAGLIAGLFGALAA